MLNSQLFTEACKLNSLHTITTFFENNIPGQKKKQKNINSLPQANISEKEPILAEQIKKKLEELEKLVEPVDFDKIMDEAKQNSYICPITDYVYITPVYVNLELPLPDPVDNVNSKNIVAKLENVAKFKIYEQAAIVEWLQINDLDPLTRLKITIEIKDGKKILSNFKVATECQKNIIKFLDQRLSFFSFIKAYECCCTGKKINDYGQALLLAAAVNDNYAVEKLLEIKANTQYLFPQNRYTALHFSVSHNNIEMVKALYLTGASFTVNAKNESPLQMAVKEKKWNIVQIFGEFESDNINGDNWEKALLLANAAGEKNIVENLSKANTHDHEFYKFAFCLEHGINTEKDQKLATANYRKAADAGHSKSQYRFANNCLHGVGTKINLTLAIKYYELAATQGHSRALCALSEFHDRGQYVEKDLKKAAQYLQLAADKGLIIAQNNLAIYFDLGQGGIKKNLEMAAKYLKLAADQGDMEAQYNIAFCYQEGCGIKKDLLLAIEYYRLAANQGDMRAQNNLGCILPNETEAFNYLQLSAERGYTEAKKNLGCNYLFGKGVAKNLPLAVKYFKMAADEQNSGAQHNYGLCLYFGLGITKDTATAISYFKLATLQGNMHAKEFLDNLTNDGFLEATLVYLVGSPNSRQTPSKTSIAKNPHIMFAINQVSPPSNDEVLKKEDGAGLRFDNS